MGGNSSSKVCLLSEKGSPLKGKDLLPVGANPFLLEYTPFKQWFCAQECSHEVTKVVSPIKMSENLPSVQSPKASSPLDRVDKHSAGSGSMAPSLSYCSTMD